MPIVEMLMPQMGESVMEATVLSWLVEEGETLEEDEPVLEVATDKVDTEIVSAYSGTLKEILVKKGEVAQIGKPIALIEVAGKHQEISLVETTDSDDVLSEITEKIPVSKHANGTNKKKRKGDNLFYSPLVKSIAKSENIKEKELESIQGTGKDFRVTKYDIFKYLKDRQRASVSSKQLLSKTEENDEVIEMDRMRQMIADRMLESQKVSAHVTSFCEADVTSVVAWREKMKPIFKSHNESLTFTPIFVEVVAKALRDHPMLNIQVEGKKIIKKRNINIGLAVALPGGNLIVPVIHNADRLSLLQLSQKVNDIARRSRNNELKPDDLYGATFTLSNIGSFGSMMGTPIIMQPQVGIVAFGSINKKSSVIETPHGDAIAIRKKMFMSHSYDHRVVDGALGGKFLSSISEYLEHFDVERIIFED